MREIQTEIRHDRIENDNRINELQSKSQSGIKTANKPNEQKNSEPVRHNQDPSKITISPPKTNNQPNTGNPPSGIIQAEKTDFESPKADTIIDDKVKQADTVIQAAQSLETKNTDSIDSTQKETAENKFSAQKNNIFENTDNRTAQTAAAFTVSKSDQKSQIVNQVPTADTGIQNRIKHDGIENTVRRDVVQNRAESGIKTKNSKVAKVKENANSGFTKSRITGAFKAAAVAGSAAANAISGSVPRGGEDDLGSESADKIKKSAGEITDKSFEAVKHFADNKTKNVKASYRGKRSHSRIYNARAKLTEHLTEHIKPLKFVRDKARSIKAKTNSKVNSLKVVKAVKKLNSIKVEDLIKTSRPVKALQSLNVTKAVKKLNSINIGSTKKAAVKRAASADKVKGAAKVTGAVGTAVRGVSSAANTVQRIKGFSNSGDIGTDLAEQTKDAAVKTVEKTAHLTKKTVKKISKSVKTMKNASKPAKRTLRTASKKTVKTSAKAAQKTAQATAKAAAKAAKTTVKISTKIISGIAKAFGSLMTSPAGPIALIIILAVVLIVVIFNLISGSVQVPVTVVSGAGSSLGWIFGDESRANDDIADIYDDFESEAQLAMGDTRANYKDRISSLGLGDRDSIVLNGASYYPANAAGAFVQSVLDGLNYSDYMYLCEICYIQKLRDERAAQGLSENEMPDVTITRTDILNFLLSYAFIFDLNIIGGQACPTNDCVQPPPGHCGGQCNPNPDGSPGSCLGHPVPPFCNHSHLKAVITIQEIPRDVLENDILMLTDEEKNMIEIALELLNDSVQP